MLFEILKWFHIVLAIVAVGANATYAVWIQRGTIDKVALPFTLRGIKLIDDRIANPSYLFILLTGLGMVLLADFPLTIPWILLSLILWLLMLLIGFFGYTPTLRKQIEEAEKGGADSDEYKAVAWRGTVLGIVLGVVVLFIIYLMVFKPALWG